MFFDFPEFGKKWLELLKEVLPRFAKIAVLRDPATGPVQIKAVDSAGKLLNVKLEILEVRGAANLNDSIVAAGGKGMDALLMTSSPPAVGATLHYLPQYSPDLNPIEMVFHPLRAYLRKAAERTIRGVARQIRVHSNHPHREFMEYCRRAGYAPL